MKQLERKWIYIAGGLMLASIIGLFLTGWLVKDITVFWGLIIGCGLLQAVGYALWISQLRCPNCGKATIRLRRFNSEEGYCPKCLQAVKIK